jgi:hypothetical protein
MRYSAIIVILISLTIAPDAQETPLSGGRLRVEVQKVVTYKAKDQFDPGPGVGAISGKAFTITIQVAARSDCFYSASYSYDPQSKKLSVQYGMGIDTGANFPFSCSSTKGIYVGQNGFGATRKIERQTKEYLSLEAQNLPGRIGGYSYELGIENDDARKLAPALAIQVSGTIATGNASAVIHTAQRSAQSFRAGYDALELGYAVQAHLDKVVLINRMNGQVIATLFDASVVSSGVSARAYGSQGQKSRVILRATAATRVTISGNDGRLYINREFVAGDTYNVPDDHGLRLAASNAGALTVVLDGTDLGPLGNSEEVLGRISLDPDTLSARQASRQRR